MGTALTLPTITSTVVPPLLNNGPTTPTPTPSPNSGPLSNLPPGSNFTVTDTSTNATATSAGTPYSGPVVGLTNEIIIATTDNINVTSKIANVFIHTGSGTDAIDVSRGNGTNVLDGSTGSNFLVGGTGFDTFFVDDRGPTADVFSTVGVSTQATTRRSSVSRQPTSN